MIMSTPLKEGHSYNLNSFTVREFRSKKYLNMPRSGAEISAINDLGSVSEVPLDEEQTTIQIVGVPVTRHVQGLRAV